MVGGCSMGKVGEGGEGVGGMRRGNSQHSTFNIQLPTGRDRAKGDPLAERSDVERWMLSVECWKLAPSSLLPRSSADRLDYVSDYDDPPAPMAFAFPRPTGADAPNPRISLGI